MGAALNVLSREFVDCAFRGVIVRCAGPQNPGGTILRDGSSDRSGGYQELHEEWRMLHAGVLSPFI